MSAVFLATASSWAAQLFDVPCETKAIVGLSAVVRPDEVPGADHVVVLSQGLVVWKGDAATLRDDAALKRRLLGGLA